MGSQCGPEEFCRRGSSANAGLSCPSGYPGLSSDSLPTFKQLPRGRDFGVSKYDKIFGMEAWNVDGSFEAKSNPKSKAMADAEPEKQAQKFTTYNEETNHFKAHQAPIENRSCDPS